MPKIQDYKPIKEELEYALQANRAFIDNMEDPEEMKEKKASKTFADFIEGINEFLTKYKILSGNTEREYSEQELTPLYQSMKDISEKFNLLNGDLKEREKGYSAPEDFEHIGDLPGELVSNFRGASYQIELTIKGLSKETKQELYPEENQIEAPANDEIGANQGPDPQVFKTMLKEIESVDPFYIKSSKDFRNAKDTIRDIIKMTEKGMEGVDKDALNEKICAAYDFTLLYTEAKSKEKNRSSLADRRLAKMNEIANSLKTQFDISNKQLGKTDITNAEMQQRLEHDGKVMENSKFRVESPRKAIAGGMYAEYLKNDTAHLGEHFNRQKATRVINGLTERIRAAEKNQTIGAAAQKVKRTITPKQIDALSK